MSIAVKDATGATQTLPTGTYDSNGALTVSMTAAPLPTGAAKSTDIAAVIQALAPLATDADTQAIVAKVEAVRALLAAVMNVQGTVTANLGTLNGAALDASVQAAVTALGTLHSDVGASHADLTAILTKLGTTLLVSAAALPLPAGAATDAKLASILTALGTPLQTGGSVSVSNLPPTQPISATGLPLPTGAATDAKLTSILTALGLLATDADLQANTAKAEAIRVLLAGTLATAPSAGENHLGEIGGNSAVATGSFTRPANTTAYAVGQLVANAAAAGSVVPVALAVARKAGGTGRITRLRLSTSNPAAVNIAFRVHLYKGAVAAPVAPTTSVGDGGTFAGATNVVAAVHLGSFDVVLDKQGSDGAKGIGTPNAGPYVTFDTNAGSQTIYALVEARTAYAPTSGETLMLAAETDRD